jgi:hypothetical protein
MLCHIVTLKWTDVSDVCTASIIREMNDDGGSMHLWNVSPLQCDYMVLHTTRPQASYLLPWEAELSQVYQGFHCIKILYLINSTEIRQLSLPFKALKLICLWYNVRNNAVIFKWSPLHFLKYIFGCYSVGCQLSSPLAFMWSIFSQRSILWQWDRNV